MWKRAGNEKREIIVFSFIASLTMMTVDRIFVVSYVHILFHALYVMASVVCACGGGEWK